MKSDTQDIVVDEVFPHAPETIWKTLTTGELIGRWLMAPTGFEPVKGTRFTFQTKPAGAWDGVIHCQVLEVMPNERFVYSWKGGHEANVGYGSPLDTVVTWTLSRVDERHAPPPRPFRLRRCRGTSPPSRPWATAGRRSSRASAPSPTSRTDATDRRASSQEKDMSDAYTGGCACGAIRYEISAEPVFMNDCQCRDCQQQERHRARLLPDLPARAR